MTVSTDTFSKILQVSELNAAVREILEGNFPLLWIEGEISNFAQPSSGHWYFSLKDARAQVRCAMFRNRNHNLALRPSDGLRVQVQAQPTLYEGRGDFQLLVEQIMAAGSGDLHAQFLALKEKLAAEGIFDGKHKRPLPPWPHRVAVITSATGAAWHDIRVTLAKRWPLLEIVLYPVPVQGVGAAKQIVQAIVTANERASEDLILLARGGGSAEDLWCFNDEAIARAIFASQLPVITGIGHEIDFSIADFAADFRAATPTAAAEAISPDQGEWLARLQLLRHRLHRAMERLLREAQQQLDFLRLRVRTPQAVIQGQEQRLSPLRQRLQWLMERRIASAELHYQDLRHRLLQHDPRENLLVLRNGLAVLRGRLEQAIQHQLRSHQQRLEQSQIQLHALSPFAILERGYALVYDPQGNVLQDASDVHTGDLLRIQLHRGNIVSRVEERN
ncbi:MAG: exodeoxyribonuclease VII large subunit [Acidithiobacillus sp.]|nr:exodeoxyribonuclease VII large subunit [Acidithiobacillus sp.]